MVGDHLGGTTAARFYYQHADTRVRPRRLSSSNALHANPCRGSLGDQLLDGRDRKAPLRSIQHALGMIGVQGPRDRTIFNHTSTNPEQLRYARNSTLNINGCFLIYFSGDTRLA
jgi:hypothetical protein